MPKWTINQVKEFASKYSYQVISTEIRSTADIISLTCPEGHDYDVKWSAFYATGNRCKACYMERSRQSRIRKKMAK